MDGGDDGSAVSGDGALRRAWLVVARRLPWGLDRLAGTLAGRDLLLEASSLAFYGLVSALPMLTLAVAVVAAVAGEDTVRQLAARAEDSGPAGTGPLLEGVLDSGGRSWAALLFTIWPATAYGGGLRAAFGRATGDEEDAPALRGRAAAVGLVLALPVLLLAGLPFAAVLSSFGDDGVVGTVVGWALALVVGAAVLTGVLVVLYHVFSPTRLSVGDTVRGAVLTAVVTTLFSVGFVAYLRFGAVEDRFGGATVGLVVMLGIYLFVANALLLGGFGAVVHLDDDGQPAGSVT